MLYSHTGKSRNLKNLDAALQICEKKNTLNSETFSSVVVNKLSTKNRHSIFKFPGKQEKNQIFNSKVFRYLVMNPGEKTTPKY